MPTNAPSAIPAEAGRRFGILGVGLLGSALARRALAAGVGVHGFDSNPERMEEFRAAGGIPAASAREVAESNARILLALPDEQVTRTVLEPLMESFETGTVLLDATTGSPESARSWEQKLGWHGVAYLEMTVSGSSRQALQGEALLMLGGQPATVDGVKDLLGVLAGHWYHTGPCGTASALKLVTNLVLGLNRAALAEGLVLAGALGLDRAQALEILRQSAAQSRVMDTKGGRMLRSEFEPEARLSQHLKDVRLMLAAAEDAGQVLPLSETHRALLERAERLGLGPLDNSAILPAIESLRQEPPRP